MTSTSTTTIDAPRVLVAHGSKHGATAEIAQAIADELRSRGLAVDCLPAGEVDAVGRYGAVVAGSAVYLKRWRPEARRFLRRHRRELAERPLWVFSSGPVGEHPDPAWSEPPGILRLAERLDLRDHVVFGGRVPADPGSFVERAMLRDTPAEVADLRDWDAIRAWAGTIADALAGARDRDRALSGG